jgi:nicotinamidase-related amidase
MMTALLIIDMQQDYFPGGKMELTGIMPVAKNVALLLASFRKVGIPVLHLQHMNYDLGSPCLIASSSGIEFHESVQPRDNEPVIKKSWPNGFIQTSLLSNLHILGVRRIVICGAMSHMCVSATARAASEIGFTCVVVHDACATVPLEFNGRTIAAEDVHGTAMATMAVAYAKVIPTQDAMALSCEYEPWPNEQPVTTEGTCNLDWK